MKQVIAVFDIGKTNKKLLLFDENFKVVYQHEQKFPIISDDDSFECDDIDLITNWISQTLIDFASKAEYNIIGVNFSTYGASLMFIDEKGNRITPVYNYLKEISPEISENIFAEYGGKNEFCRKTASPALGLLLNSGIQMLWLKNKKPEHFSKVKSILHLPQYLSYKLTDEIISEPTSIGCHTFLWDFDKMNYHQWVSDKGFDLPKPLTNDVVYPVKILDREVLVGTGIHDSSASLVPYLKASKTEFILVSTGTWCINMNPFNNEPLTAEQLENDCLCFLSPDKQQVKSSRLFMGHFHDVWVEKLAEFFKVNTDNYKELKYNKTLIDSIIEKYVRFMYFPEGKESFNNGLQNLDLHLFDTYEFAYTKLMIELTALCVDAIKLIIPENDKTEIVYISGGFARNEIFIGLLNAMIPDKKILVSEIDNSSALGAALVISKVFTNSNAQNLDLGII